MMDIIKEYWLYIIFLLIVMFIIYNCNSLKIHNYNDFKIYYFNGLKNSKKDDTSNGMNLVGIKRKKLN